MMGHRDMNDRCHSEGGRICLIRAGNVYDVTEFADRHPGGRELLEKHSMEDVERSMQDPASHVHSKAAYSILDKYFVGDEETFRNKIKDYAELQDRKKKLEAYYKNDIVDWSKPFVGQVPFLGEKYFDWTHQQVDRPIRLFKSDIVEVMTKARWWFVPVVWIPVVICSLYTSFIILSEATEVWPHNALGCQLGPTSIPFLTVFGFVLWTLLEYVIHRWLFHLRPPSNWPSLIWLHFVMHGQHHKSPMDPTRLVFPPLPGSVFVSAFLALCMALFPRGATFAVFAGLITGYIAYDLTHYYVHHGNSSIAYIQKMKTYHIQHHYQHQEIGFGVTSKFWDYFFQTRIPEDQELVKKD